MATLVDPGVLANSPITSFINENGRLITGERSDPSIATQLNGAISANSYVESGFKASLISFDTALRLRVMYSDLPVAGPQQFWG